MGWEVNATSQPLYSRERRSTHGIESWVGHGAGLDGCGKSRLHRDSIPGPLQPVSTYNSNIQLSGDSVIPRTEQKLRTINLHFSFPRLRRWDSPLAEIKQSMVDSHRMAAALQRTMRKCNSERADQRISVHFRTMTTILAKAPTEGFLLPSTGILDCTSTYGPVQAPFEKTQITQYKLCGNKTPTRCNR